MGEKRHMNTSKLGNIEEMKEDAILKKIIIDTAVDVQSALQLLIAKEIITSDELNTMRAKVKTLPKYAASYQYINDIAAAADAYEKDPQAFLKAMFNAKLRGKM